LGAAAGGPEIAGRKPRGHSGRCSHGYHSSSDGAHRSIDSNRRSCHVRASGRGQRSVGICEHHGCRANRTSCRGNTHHAGHCRHGAFRPSCGVGGHEDRRSFGSAGSAICRSAWKPFTGSWKRHSGCCNTHASWQHCRLGGQPTSNARVRKRYAVCASHWSARQTHCR